MSRHDYPLTEQTLAIWNGNCPLIAQEMHVNKSYIYGVLEGMNPDPFAYFEAAYAATVDAGLDTTEWDARLAEIRSRRRPPVSELNGHLTDKLKEEAETNCLLVKAMEDGHIDEREKKPILKAVEVERKTLDFIESHVAGDVREFANKAVAKRKAA